MIKYLLYIKIFLNLLVIFYYNRKTIRKIFYNPKIPVVDVENLDKIFIPKIKKNNLKFPKNDTIINTFCVPGNYNVVGMTSDYESWILGSLSKKALNIFEFGTCSGRTTYLFGLNSPQESKIVTITLDPNKLDEVKNKKNKYDNSSATLNILNESIYEEFMFSGQEVEKKIEVIFKDSRDLDVTNLEKKFDLIFIDGGHTYSCIKNDTEKALKMINNNGLILWHDYSVGKRSHNDVYKYLEEISFLHKIYNIRDTSLCFYRKV